MRDSTSTFAKLLSALGGRSPGPTGRRSVGTQARARKAPFGKVAVNRGSICR